jgi:hypothetical protein
VLLATARSCGGMRLNWRPGPGARNPAEPWLYGADERAGEVLALLDPWVAGPSDAQDVGVGRWRLARYELQEEPALRDALEEHLEAEALPEEIKLVLGAVLGRSPSSVRAIGCGEVLELVGDDGFEWVAQRTEQAVRQLLGVIRLGEREEVLVSRGELVELGRRLALLRELLDDWVQCGGRFGYLRGLVSAINDRRAGLLDAMDEQPTSLPEWARHLQHRMVDHLADVAEEPEMSHGQADELAWTAAMALEAAFTLATRAGDQSTLHEMLDEATRGLVDALDHGHDDSADWLQCATHTGLDMPDAADNDEQRAEALGRMLAIYAHLAGAIVQAGRIGCARAGHSHDDE